MNGLYCDATDQITSMQNVTMISITLYRIVLLNSILLESLLVGVSSIIGLKAKTDDIIIWLLLKYAKRWYETKH